MKKLVKSLMVLAVSVVGGTFYRMGGSGNFPRQIRMAGQMVCFVAVMAILGIVPLHWRPVLGVFLGSGICWAQSTYFKASGTDARWYHWALVGGVFGATPLPWVILTGHGVIGFGIRFALCVVLTVLWQTVISDRFCRMIGIGKDIGDEFGRGFINIITLPLLLI